MQTFIVVLIAYLITGAHFVWRDLSASIVHQPAYARHPTVSGVVMRVLTWLPVTISLPSAVGWYWRGLKRYVFSLVLFVVLTSAGLFLGPESFVYAIVPPLASIVLWVAIRWYWGRRRETDPIKLRMRQAAKLNWKQTDEVTKDGDGAPWTKRSVLFLRGNEEAVLWHKDARITLVRLSLPFDFDDFIELEEFIAKHPREADLDEATGELRYLREIELFFVRHGYRDDLMRIRATDYAFLVAFGKLVKAGYAAGEDVGVVAALVLHVIQFHEHDRERAIRWLTRTTEDFNRRRPQDD